jgi:hypothetical protein
MSASNEWTEWHLTPAGWVRGSERMDFAQLQSRPTPLDRVLTVTNKEVGNGYGPIHASQQEDWRSDDADAVAELLVKFGKAPKSL